MLFQWLGLAGGLMAGWWVEGSKLGVLNRPEDGVADRFEGVFEGPKVPTCTRSLEGRILDIFQDFPANQV